MIVCSNRQLLVILFLVGFVGGVLGIWYWENHYLTFNEAAAKAHCEAICIAAGKYYDKFDTHAKLEQLIDVGFLDKSFAEKEVGGYRFEFQDKGCSCTARPVVPGETGSKIFSSWYLGYGVETIVEKIVYVDNGEDALLKTSTEQLKKSKVTSHMEEGIKTGENLLYCSTFQLAWNELKDTIVKEDIRFVDELQIVEFLNKNLSTKEDISEDAYVAMAGMNRDGILSKINRALKSKFKDHAPTVNTTFNYPEDILVYSFLFKNLKFENDFESLKNPVEFESSDSSVKVKAFGIEKYHKLNLNHLKLIRQLDIVDYISENDFVIGLKSKVPNDEIILAKIAPQKTLLETIDSVMERVKNNKPGIFHEDDTLKIPKMNFDIMHAYNQLYGKYLQNEGFEKYFIGGAVQNIRFSMNEKGVVLKSSSSLLVTLGRGAFEHVPINMIFDKPFLIYLKEKDAKFPYFAMWVDNAELMVKE